MSLITRGYAQAILLIGSVVGVGYVTIGFPALLFGIALVGGIPVWRLSTLPTPIGPEKIIIPYLVTVLFFIVHVAEEYVTHIQVLLSALSGRAISETQFLLVAAFFAPALWIVGAILLLARIQLGGFLASAFLFGMIFGEASHFAFPFLQDGRFHYASGMVTACPLILSAAYTLHATLRDVRAVRSRVTNHGAGH